MPGVCLPTFSFHKTDTDSVILLEKKNIGMFDDKSDEERKIMNFIINSPGFSSIEKPGNTTAITAFCFTVPWKYTCGRGVLEEITAMFVLDFLEHPHHANLDGGCTIKSFFPVL